MVQLLLESRLMLRKNLRVFLPLIIVIYSFHSEGITCKEAYRLSPSQRDFYLFLSRVESENFIPWSLRQLTTELSRGVENIVIRISANMQVDVSTIKIENKLVFRINRIKAQKVRSHEYNKNMQMLVYSLIRGAQKYYRNNPEINQISLSMARSKNDDVVLWQRVLGFLWARENWLYLPLNIKDLALVPRTQGLDFI